MVGDPKISEAYPSKASSSLGDHQAEADHHRNLEAVVLSLGRLKVDRCHKTVGDPGDPKAGTSVEVGDLKVLKDQEVLKLDLRLEVHLKTFVFLVSSLKNPALGLSSAKVTQY